MNILEEANKLTGGDGDRTKDYGSCIEEASRMTNAINDLFGTSLKPEDWYLILIIMKMKRHINRAKRDNLVDIAGYARVLEIMYAEQGIEGYVPR